MNSKLYLFTALLTLISVNVYADISSDNIFGIKYMQQQAESSNVNTLVDEELDGIIFKYGRFFWRFLAVEVHFGYSEKERNNNGTTAIYNDYIASAFARGNFPIHNYNINLYVLGGFSTAKLTLDTPLVLTGGISTGGKSSTTENGVAYGAGIEFYGTPNTSLTFEWTEYLNKDEFSLSGLSIGFVHHFKFPQL